MDNFIILIFFYHPVSPYILFRLQAPFPYISTFETIL